MGPDGAVLPPPPPPRVRTGDRIVNSLDRDGLPPPGLRIAYDEPVYVVLDTVTNTHKIVRHKDLEGCCIDEVRVLAPSVERKAVGAGVEMGPQNASIKLRYNRNPVVGDKFASRAGQKGVLSYLWPQQDMPFTDSGMTPDVIINPHAFPSRMTIGMLIESMAGKAGACHGTYQDSTPFRFDEGHRALDHFGTQLRAAGYSYYGTETMYSGVTGEPLHCDIYLGVVYYQRLRHMVSDKSQVRSTGPMNQLTRQPVKGRKKHGGIRFGEMERDSLLAHGASFTLHDRLHNSSDRHIALVCKQCGSMLAPHSVPASASIVTAPGTSASAAGAASAALANLSSSGAADPIARLNRTRRMPVCRSCGSGDGVVAIAMPYVFRYLANELAAMNVRVQLEVGQGPYSAAT